MSEKELTDREIEAIRAAAGELPLLEPSRDLWPGIEARLGAQVVDINRNAHRRPRGRVSIVVSARMLASAAAILVMATAGTTYVVLRDRMPAGSDVAAALPTTQPAQQGLGVPASFTVGGEFGAYTQEIGDLQTAIAERRSRLDPATIAVIERNLRVIDAAIEESKQALANDPASPLLTELLSEALANKVRLLRQAALLPPLT